MTRVMIKLNLNLRRVVAVILTLVVVLGAMVAALTTTSVAWGMVLWVIKMVELVKGF